MPLGKLRRERGKGCLDTAASLARDRGQDGACLRCVLLFCARPSSPKNQCFALLLWGPRGFCLLWSVLLAT